MTTDDTWERFRDRHLAHMRGTIGFDERSSTWRLWDEWKSREARRINAEALAESTPARATETRMERIIRYSREDAARERRNPTLNADNLIGIGPGPASHVIATETEIADALRRANGACGWAELDLDRRGLRAMRGAL